MPLIYKTLKERCAADTKKFKLKLIISIITPVLTYKVSSILFPGLGLKN
jgi:hypothetical protein